MIQVRAPLKKAVNIGFQDIFDSLGLFAANTTRLVLRRGFHLRSYAYEFIHKPEPGLTEARIAESLLVQQGVTQA